MVIDLYLISKIKFSGETSKDSLWRGEYVTVSRNLSSTLFKAFQKISLNPEFYTKRIFFYHDQREKGKVLK